MGCLSQNQSAQFVVYLNENYRTVVACGGLVACRGLFRVGEKAVKVIKINE